MSDEDVSTLLGFIQDQLSPDQARTLIRQSGSLDAAINKYFDNPAGCIQPEDLSYDVSAFSAGRSGEPDYNSLPSFNIVHADGVENYPHSTTHSVPPSRPPSRTSIRSAASPAHGDVPVQSIEEMQESGIIGNAGNSKPFFGPANRDNYDNNWALVLHSTSTEMIPDAVPSARKREEDGPVIVKPTPSGNYFPALLTILHTIPSIRNIFLAPEISLSNYSAGDEWWKGNPSAPARTIEYGSDDTTTQNLELIHETQRLMAFLDATNRAYGSVGGLQQLDAWGIERPDLDSSIENDLLKFLLKWGEAYENATKKSLTGILRTAFDIGGVTRESFLLDASIIYEPPSGVTDLYTVIDNELFESGNDKAHIAVPSNVLIFRLENSKSNATALNCIVPPIFYADRYLEENKIIIDAMHQEKKIFLEQIQEIEARAGKLRVHKARTVRNGQALDTLQLLETSMKAFKPKPETLIDDPKDLAVIAHLQSVYDSIKRKLDILDAQKSKIYEALEQMTKDFKMPLDSTSQTTMENLEDGSDAESSKPLPFQTRPYKLCGVSTFPNVYYVKHPDANSKDDWWRLEYSTATSDVYILRERLNEISVLEKAKSEHRSALLVYANEEALNERPALLPEALSSFLKEDNQAFEKELDGSYDYQDADQGLKVIGDWDQGPPDYQDPTLDPFAQDDWDHVSAKELNEQMNMTAASSATLTPNTNDYESNEYNGGIDSWAGISNASSDTVGGEVMDTGIEQGQSQMQQQKAPHGTVSLRDVEMLDVDLTDTQDQRPKVQHIEMVEKKGG